MFGWKLKERAGGVGDAQTCHRISKPMSERTSEHMFEHITPVCTHVPISCLRARINTGRREGRVCRHHRDHGRWSPGCEQLLIALGIEHYGSSTVIAEQKCSCPHACRCARARGAGVAIPVQHAEVACTSSHMHVHMGMRMDMRMSMHLFKQS